MKLRFALRTAVHFSEPVTGHVFRVRALPPDLPGQRILESRLSADPVTVFSRVYEPVFGNVAWTGRIDAPHSAFVLCAEGTAVTDSSAVDRTEPQPYFIEPTRLTQPGPAVRALLESLEGAEDASETDRVLRLSNAVHRAFRYSPGTTSTLTTGEAALARGKGVCQDYSHALIALLRLAGIPAVYCAGLVQGTGATHAWVQAWTEGRWLSIDPTHACLVDERYLTLARGCDFAEAALERGLFLGSATQTMRTSAKLEPMEP